MTHDGPRRGVSGAATRRVHHTTTQEGTTVTQPPGFYRHTDPSGDILDISPAFSEIDGRVVPVAALALDIPDGLGITIHIPPGEVENVVAAIRTAAGQDQPADRRERCPRCIADARTAGVIQMSALELYPPDHDPVCMAPSARRARYAVAMGLGSEYPQSTISRFAAAVIAVADTEQEELRADLELAGRVKRSAARDAAAALTAQIAAEAEVTRLRAELAQARSAALTEAAVFLRRTPRDSADYQGALRGARLIEDELRRMAGEDAQPEGEVAR